MSSSLGFTHLKPNPPLLRGIYKNATYFYEEAPWRICEPSHVVCVQAFGQTRVAQLVGMSDSTKVGLALWNNYESFKGLLQPDKDPFRSFTKGEVVWIDYSPLSTLPASEKSLVKRFSLTIPDKEHCPVFFAVKNTYITTQVLRIFEVALNVVPEFYKSMKKKTTHSYEALTMTRTVETASGESVEVTLSYPAGIFDYMDGGITTGELPGCTRWECPLPAHIKSICEALGYYRAQLAGMNAVTSPDELQKLSVKQLKSLLKEQSVSAAGCLDRDDLLETALRACAMGKLSAASEKKKIAVMFAIADLLKRLQTEKSSNEALEMAYETLKVDPDDPFEVRYFVLDVALEIDAYDKAVEIMERYPGDWSAEWLWTSALLQYKSKGPDSNRAKKALREAVKQNPHVVEYLLGEVPMPAKDAGSYTITFLGGGIAHGDRNEAVKYLRNYQRHWYFAKGAIDWVKDVGAKFRDKQEKQDANIMACHEKGKPYPSTKIAEVRIPSVVLCCKSCGKNGVPLKRCSRCLKVSYCSIECQRADWKAGHKGACTTATAT